MISHSPCILLTSASSGIYSKKDPILEVYDLGATKPQFFLVELQRGVRGSCRIFDQSRRASGGRVMPIRVMRKVGREEASSPVSHALVDSLMCSFSLLWKE